MPMKITLIGGGNMGEAMLAAILKAGIAEGPITVCDINAERLEYVAREYGAAAVADPRAAMDGSDVVALAVKPQNLDEVAQELRGAFETNQLVLSILAGTTLARLRTALEHAAIVRAMPNMPARIGRGMTVWTATARTARGQRELARSILQATGQEVFVENEDDIDRATAISGSGPAYVFYFAEALTSAGAGLGLPPETSARLVLATFLGAAHLLGESGKDATELRSMVTSPGGTTAAAIDTLHEGDLSGLVGRAARAAYERARQLSG